MKDKIYIGIDPGETTGIAVWNSSKKKFIEFKGLKFWDAIKYVTEHLDDYDVKLIIENPNMNKAMHLSTIKGSKSEAMTLNIAQKVGMNKRDAKLWIDYCKFMQVSFHTVKPIRRKLDSDMFNRLTGWKERSNQHSRDAGMLVFGR